MEIIATVAEMRMRCRDARRNGKKLGLVATMGALHEGHISLFRAAASRCDVVAGSIFVNPTQFGPNEDFAKYPRTFERDRKLLDDEQVHLLFVPTVEEMYPRGMNTFVNVEKLSDRLDGKSRPGHFRGVATIVCKLFHVIEPDVAFFGQKDAAQVAVMRSMARDLNFDIEIAVCPIVREPDGLAMSSRNAYLTPAQRQSATVLYRALRRVKSAYQSGEHDSSKLMAIAERVFREEPQVQVDYLEMVDCSTLEPAARASSGALVAVAAYVGSTRLIDNIVL